MAPPIPSRDGEINCYNLKNSSEFTPRIYFVNGIRVLPREHAVTASYLSLLIERPVWGVHNSTAGVNVGSIVDFSQCLLDYAQNVGARLSSHRNLNKPPKIPDHKIPAFLAGLDKQYLVWNKATAALFKALVKNRNGMQMIVAHSQGNLITSNALFAMEDVLGSAVLRRIRVYSLASPAPAWPLGIRKTHGGGGRQENAFMNDLVALLRPHNLAKKVGIARFQNAGDFRTHEKSGPVGAAPHDTNEIISTLNFLKSIRGDLGLSKEFSPKFLAESSRIAEKAFPRKKSR